MAMHCQQEDKRETNGQPVLKWQGLKLICEYFRPTTAASTATLKNLNKLSTAKEQIPQTRFNCTKQQQTTGHYIKATAQLWNTEEIWISLALTLFFAVTAVSFGPSVKLPVLGRCVDSFFLGIVDLATAAFSVPKALDDLRAIRDFKSFRKDTAFFRTLDFVSSANQNTS